MSALSVRSLPKKVEQALAKELKKSGKTKSQIVIQALEQFFHLDPKETRRKKIRRFFGKMSEEDFTALQKANKDFENIDQSLWK